ncbi:hypothetical protein HYV74_03995 [Candidatus Uhrbacteria bacterium]|nr:hypothetical protein [Candidatus Uhrbacteria bacterium]
MDQLAVRERLTRDQPTQYQQQLLEANRLARQGEGDRAYARYAAFASTLTESGEWHHAITVYRIALTLTELPVGIRRELHQRLARLYGLIGFEVDADAHASLAHQE